MENNRHFSTLVFFTVSGFCSNFISFVSPYWIQSVPEARSQFQRIGLWTVCFDGYMRPGLYDKAYFGCYYIYYVIYDRVRDWLNPVWLYAIQVTSSCGILIQFLVLFTVLCQVSGAIPKSDIKTLKFVATGHFFTCLTLAAALIAFAVARYDSRWMPYPELNVLSWSYAVGVLSFVCTFIAFIISFITYLDLDEIAKQQRASDNLLENEANMGISSPPPPPMIDDPRYTEPHYLTDQQSVSYLGGGGGPSDIGGSSRIPNKSWKDSEITYDANEDIIDSENPTSSRFNTGRYTYDPRS
uniref:Uncharacterized protein n=1 Tax=Trichobilharzia regenti TaxID=157069 RepID=A0AA85JSE3_TRIRE|nr:unnamed protein product [Trichobilharzia regenti]